MEDQLHYSHTPVRTRRMVRQRNKKNVLGQLSKKCQAQVRFKELRVAGRASTKWQCAFSYHVRYLHGSRELAFIVEPSSGSVWVRFEIFREARTQKPQQHRRSLHKKSQEPWRVHGEVHVQACVPRQMFHRATAIHKTRTQGKALQW